MDVSRVQISHGGGGRMMHKLIDQLFLSAFATATGLEKHDGAVVELPPGRLAFTTDSYVVDPLFFPGGDIGTLAVYGTVNDLAMCGARPLYLSAGFILEEGLSVEVLQRVVESMSKAAERAGVKIVTGDTKVVERGKCDKLFINTAGVGVVEHDLNICPRSIKPGDAIILNGDIGRHGVAIMAQREGFKFESAVESDCAPLSPLVLKLLNAGIQIHCLRDLTRGGLASALVEIAETAELGIEIDETKIPIIEAVKGACELLGIDPLYMANEGRMVAFVPLDVSEPAVKIMRGLEIGRGSVAIGKVTGDNRARVTLKTRIGSSRIVEMFSGEQLPRIC